MHSLLLVGFCLIASPVAALAQATLDFDAYDPSSSIQITKKEEHLSVHWSVSSKENALAHLSLTNPHALIQSIQIQSGAQAPTPIIENANIAFDLNIGERSLAKNAWTVFFDDVDKTSVRSGPLTLNLQNVRVEATSTRATVKYSSLTFDTFAGELWFTFYEGSPLNHGDGRHRPWVNAPPAPGNTSISSSSSRQRTPAMPSTWLSNGPTTIPTLRWRLTSASPLTTTCATHET